MGHTAVPASVGDCGVADCYCVGGLKETTADLGRCVCVCVCVSICEMVVRTEKIERQREAIKKVKERMKQCVQSVVCV